MRRHGYKEARIAIIILCLAIMPGCALMEWFQQRHEDSKEVATKTVDSEKGKKVTKVVNTVIEKAIKKVIPVPLPSAPKTPDKDGDGGWGWFLTYGAAFILGLRLDEEQPEKKKKKSTKKKGKQ